MTNKINKKLPSELENQIKKRNKITALAGLGGVLLGLGSSFALLPPETQQKIQQRVENAIYTAGARELEGYLPSFAVPFTRYNHLDTSEHLKSDILNSRKKLGESFESFIYQTAQNQSRAVSGKILEDASHKNSIENVVKRQTELLEQPISWEVENPVSRDSSKRKDSTLEKHFVNPAESYQNNIVNSDFVSYIIHVESSGNPKAVGSSGERGLMQLMWGTWHDSTKRVYGTPISFEKAFKPEENIRAGVAQLEWLEQAYLPERIPGWESYSETKKRDAIIAAYNIGANGFIRNYHGNPYHQNLPQTTKNYIAKIESLISGKKQVGSSVLQWAGLIEQVLEE